MMMVVVATALAMGGASGWGTTRPATLCWGCTQGPPRTSFRHQRITEADARGALATKGTIFWARIRLAGESWGRLWGAAEPQLWHRVAVGGPSQKVGGLLRVCNGLRLRAGPFAHGLGRLRSGESGCGCCERCGDRARAPAPAARPGRCGLRPQAAGSRAEDQATAWQEGAAQESSPAATTAEAAV